MFNGFVVQIRQDRDDRKAGHCGTPCFQARIRHVHERLLCLFHSSVNRQRWQGPELRSASLEVWRQCGENNAYMDATDWNTPRFTAIMLIRVVSEK